MTGGQSVDRCPPSNRFFLTVQLHGPILSVCSSHLQYLLPKLGGDGGQGRAPVILPHFNSLARTALSMTHPHETAAWKTLEEHAKLPRAGLTNAPPLFSSPLISRDSHCPFLFSIRCGKSRSFSIRRERVFEGAVGGTFKGNPNSEIRTFLTACKLGSFFDLP